MAEELGWYVSPDVMQPRSETQSQSESETVSMHCGLLSWSVTTMSFRGVFGQGFGLYW